VVVDFQEADLVGTWQEMSMRSYKLEQRILRSDHTFRQVFARKVPSGNRFEAKGTWSLEYASSGGLYLHLKGMHNRNSTDELCRDGRWGGGFAMWWDSCEDTVVRTPGEVVSLVTGTADMTPTRSRTRLWYMPAEPDSGTGYFELMDSLLPRDA
jgi:hypothetical protein